MYEAAERQDSNSSVVQPEKKEDGNNRFHRGYDPRYGSPELNYAEWTQAFKFIRVVGSTPPYRQFMLPEEKISIPDEEL